MVSWTNIDEQLQSLYDFYEHFPHHTRSAFRSTIHYISKQLINNEKARILQLISLHSIVHKDSTFNNQSLIKQFNCKMPANVKLI